MRFIVPILLLLAVVPAAALTGVFEVSSITAAGSAEATGNLAALRFRSAQALEPPRLSFATAEVVLLSHYTQTGPSGISIDNQAGSETVFEGQASSGQVTYASDFDVWAQAPPYTKATLAAPSVLLAAHNHGEVTRPTYIPIEEAPEGQSVEGTLTIQVMEPSDLSINGTIVFWFWDVNITLATDDGDVNASSGYGQTTPPSQDPLALDGYRSQVLELRIQGTVQASGLQAMEYFFIAPQNLTAAGSISMEPYPLAASDIIRAEGLHQASVSNVDNRSFDVHFQSPADMPLTPEENPMPGAGVIQPVPAPSQDQWIVAIASGAFLAFGMSPLFVKLHQARLMEQMREASRLGFPEYVLRHAAKLRRSRVYRTEALSLLAVASLNTETPEQTRDRLEPWQRHMDPALQAFLNAVLKANEGDMAAADAAANLLNRLNPELAAWLPRRISSDSGSEVA